MKRLGGRLPSGAVNNKEDRVRTRLQERVGRYDM